ncbi:amidase family protein [Natrarchaeobius chitinivorans]|uniref:Amidase n=1 Tax=Natrarchaeobius chitinivorans TaxID=1679083 RepID=A0A3N6LNV1_NATCH|nr:amidase family protein [Natrarchaeobius chitinivorans]RQG89717.1 amidase [Natrarchaeobius chitinivorans]
MRDSNDKPEGADHRPNTVPLTPPTKDRIQSLASRHFLSLEEDELDAMVEFLPTMLGVYERIDEAAGHADVSLTPECRNRTSTIPDDTADPYNAFVRQCTIEHEPDAATDDRPLSGWDVGVKDNIAVADIPMQAGSDVLAGYVPDRDATVVTQLLEAGATVRGKLTMDALAVAGSGELAAEGVVSNPRNPAFLAGGSSSGSAAAVVTDAVDVAISTDQGGSGRIPASWSGCVGLKPSYGQVPFTGAMSLGHSLDHIGIIARTVDRCARTLEVVSGFDPEDPRQRADHDTVDLDRTQATGGKPDAPTVGVLEEGFDTPFSEETVDDAVRSAMSSINADTLSVSIPPHETGMDVWTAIANGEIISLFRDEGVIRSGPGRYDDHFAEAFSRLRRERGASIQPLVKYTLVLGEYLSETYGSRHYIQAKRLARDLGTAYADAFEDVDVLAMPTTPHTAHRIEPDLSTADRVRRAISMVYNTAPFNVTGHPALSIPCATVTEEELPVGVMLVGARGADETLLAIGREIEDRLDPFDSD